MANVQKTANLSTILYAVELDIDSAWVDEVNFETIYKKGSYANWISIDNSHADNDDITVELTNNYCASNAHNSQKVPSGTVLVLSAGDYPVNKVRITAGGSSGDSNQAVVLLTAGILQGAV